MQPNPDRSTASVQTVDDRLGLPVTSASVVAVAGLDAAVDAVLGHRAEAGALLSGALAGDPGLLLGHALRGFAGLMLGREEGRASARAALAAAEASAEARGCTARERLHLDALGHWATGRMDVAAEALGAAVRLHPHDLAALKLEHAARFMLGDAAGMRCSLERSAPAWTLGLPGRGYVLGCLAFAFEETGDLAAAVAAGRDACEAEPRDAWGTHAVAHAHEMRGEAVQGSAWLETREPALAGLGNFAHHLVWHQGLFLLEIGRPRLALELYDRRMGAIREDDYRDLANAASLLARLEEEGVAAGHRWERLADLAERRIGEAHSAFAAAHDLLALAGAGRARTVEDMLASLRFAARRRVETGRGATQAKVLAEVGLALAEALAARARGAHGEANDHFLRARHALPRIGGSHAQRDVFWRLGIESALLARRFGTARSLLAERAALYPNSSWAEARCARAEHMAGQHAPDAA